MKGMTYSLCIHGILLSLLAFKGCSGGGAGAEGQKDQQQGAQNEKDKQGEQIAKNDVVEVDIIPPPQKGDALGKAEEDGFGPPQHVGDDCEHFFGGIGITQSYGAKSLMDHSTIVVVAEVHHGYPAEKAGIKVGDEILNSSTIRGEIGTAVVVQTIRNGSPLRYTIVRDKICTSPPKGKASP